VDSNTEGSILTEDEFTGRPELVKKRARSIMLQRLVVALVAVYMVFTMTVVVITSIEGIRARKILLDCTTQEGRCFKENARRTAAVVAGINKGTKDIVVLAAGCAKDPRNDTTSKIEKCVNKELEKR